MLSTRTFSNKSFIDVTLKCLFWTSVKALQSMRMWLTVSGHWQVVHSGGSVPDNRWLMKELLGKGYCVSASTWTTSTRSPATAATDRRRRYRHSEPQTPIQTWRNVSPKARLSPNVAVLSTYHEDHMKTVSQHEERKENPMRSTPTTITWVDLADQMLTTLAAIHANTRGIKSGTRSCSDFFWTRLRLTATYCTTKSTSTRRRLSSTLEWSWCSVCWKSSTICRPSRQVSWATVACLTRRHFSSLLPPNAGKQAPTRCRVCCASSGRDWNKVQREMHYYCKDCDVPLCSAPCFELFHIKRNYWILSYCVRGRLTQWLWWL